MYSALASESMNSYLLPIVEAYKLAFFSPENPKEDGVAGGDDGGRG